MAARHGGNAKLFSQRARHPFQHHVGLFHGCLRYESPPDDFVFDDSLPLPSELCQRDHGSAHDVAPEAEHQRTRHQNARGKVVGLPFQAMTRRTGARDERWLIGLVLVDMSVELPVPDLMGKRETVAAFQFGEFIGIKAFIDHDFARVDAERAQNIVESEQVAQVANRQVESQVQLENALDGNAELCRSREMPAARMAATSRKRSSGDRRVESAQLGIRGWLPKRISLAWPRARATIAGR